MANVTNMNRLRVDVWSDIACPWCYIGKRRLESALLSLPHRDGVDVVWRAFELDPSAPRERDRGTPYAERLAKKYGSSVQEAEAMIRRMTEAARNEGLDFHFERIRPGNTFDAHRLLHLVAERGLQDAVKERLLRGYMTEGAPIGDPETLVRLLSEAGLDPSEIRSVLASDRYAEEVRADEAEASRLGSHSVPFFVIGGRYGVSGAQPPQLLRRALEQAWTEMHAEPEVESMGKGAACGPDGCA